MGNSQNPLARMAGKRETKCLKPIDKAIFGMVSELSGRNKSECVGGLEINATRRLSHRRDGESRMD